MTKKKYLSLFIILVITFTASIIGTCLAVDEVVIWKDVDGLWNADPKWFDNTKVLKNISYKEAIELSLKKYSKSKMLIAFE